MCHRSGPDLVRMQSAKGAISCLANPRMTSEQQSLLTAQRILQLARI